MLRQLEEPRLLLGERLDDQFFALARHAALVHDAVDPGIELAIEIGERAVGAGCEEGFSDVANTTLGPTLFITTRNGDGLGCEVIVPSELEDAIVKTDEIALTLQHDAFQVVVQDGPRNAAQLVESLDVAAQEALEGLIEG